MDTDKLCEAYSLRDDHALSEELGRLQTQLINQTWAIGPAAVALQLRSEKRLTPILSRLWANAEDAPGRLLARRVGFISAYLNYIEIVADRQAAVSAAAQLYNNDHVDPVRIMILRCTFAHAGVPATDIVTVVARMANISESLIEPCISELVGMKLLERVKWKGGFVTYRITSLGEAVVSHLSNPHELALFFIDKAAFDEGLRTAIREEIKTTWPEEQ